MAPVRTLATINYAEVVFQCKHQAMHLKNVKIYQFMAPITVKPSLHRKSYNDPVLDNCYNIIVLYQSSITIKEPRFPYKTGLDVTQSHGVSGS